MTYTTQGTIRRASGKTDFVSFYDHKVYTGRCWFVSVEGVNEMAFPSSWTKTRIREYVKDVIGQVDWV